MKILFISSSSGSRGGGELYLIFLGEALRKQGFEVGLWCSNHARMDELANSFNQLGKVFRSDYANTYDYALRSIRYLFPKTVKSLKKIIDDFNPDMIHMNKQNVEDGLDLLITLDQYKLPYVTTIHITQTEKSLGALLGGWRDSISRKILQRSKSLKWIAISSGRSRDLINFLGSKDNVIMIPNGVKVEPNIDEDLKKNERIKLNVPKNNLVVICVGRLELQKDPLKFIDWAEQCLKGNPNLIFFWIGDGSLRSSFEKRINDLKLSHKISCLGWQKEVASFYAMADIYLHTARYEGLPFSLLEAMSWKIPCVVSEELYEDLSFPEDVIYKGFKGLELLVNHKNIRTNAGDQAQEYIKKNFSLEVITKSYLSVYKSVGR